MRHAALLALLLATAAVAQIHPPLPNAGPPLILQLDGTLADARAAAGGFTVVTLDLRGKQPLTRYLGVERARTLGGDQPLLGKDVLDALAPFDRTLIVAGPPDLVAKLRALPAGSGVRVEGLVSISARTWYLRRVEESPASG